MQLFRAASLRVFDRRMVCIISTAAFCRTPHDVEERVVSVGQCRKCKERWISMQRSSGSTVDLGLSSICTGIPMVLVFWWAFFMESLSGPSSTVGMASRRALA